MLHMTLGHIYVLGLRKSLSRKSCIERNMVTMYTKLFFVASRNQFLDLIKSLSRTNEPSYKESWSE
jgi:hypothetical protein